MRSNGHLLDSLRKMAPWKGAWKGAIGCRGAGWTFSILTRMAIKNIWPQISVRHVGEPSKPHQFSQKKKTRSEIPLVCYDNFTWGLEVPRIFLVEFFPPNWALMTWWATPPEVLSGQHLSKIHPEVCVFCWLGPKREVLRSKGVFVEDPKKRHHIPRS